MDYNIIYAFDNNYVEYACVSIISLLENNKDMNFVIYLLIDGVKEQNSFKLKQSILQYKNVTLKEVDFSDISKTLELSMEWSISKSAYARLFLTDLLSADIEKILYLDCDTIINKSIKELFDLDIKEYDIGAVLDSVPDETKEAVGLEYDAPYFNSGVVLFNLKKMRLDKINQEFSLFLKKYNGRVVHHDQGVLNGVLKNKVKVLPLRYNVMTIHYQLSLINILKYFKYHGDFYSEEEVEESKENPVILHYTPSFTVRPWVKGCNHPLRNKYIYYKNKTLWKDSALKNDTTSSKVKLVNLLFKILPNSFFLWIMGRRQ